MTGSNDPQHQSQQNWADADAKASRTCEKSLDKLLDCVTSTDCVKNGGSMKHCLRNDPVAAEQCSVQRQNYMMCKHGQINMRMRFKGKLDP